MAKIAVMGDYDSIYGFSALGLSIFPIRDNDEEEASRIFRNLAENDFGIIYITEELAAVISREIAKYRDCPEPAVILIPGIHGNTGEGIAGVKKTVEQAVGSDILFSNE
ncbi:MAG: V-type ATP synthase subunit F [Eubacteriales bacterium]|jgi:V/A-type H+-transporting ATPase subunit F